MFGQLIRPFRTLICASPQSWWRLLALMSKPLGPMSNSHVCGTLFYPSWTIWANTCHCSSNAQNIWVTTTWVAVVRYRPVPPTWGEATKMEGFVVQWNLSCIIVRSLLPIVAKIHLWADREFENPPQYRAAIIPLPWYVVAILVVSQIYTEICMLPSISPLFSWRTFHIVSFHKGRYFCWLFFIPMAIHSVWILRTYSNEGVSHVWVSIMKNYQFSRAFQFRSYGEPHFVEIHCLQSGWHMSKYAPWHPVLCSDTCASHYHPLDL